MKKVIKNNINLNIKLLLAIFSLLLLVGSLTEGEVLRHTRPIVRNVESQVVSFRVRNYNQLETENFIIMYQDTSEEILNLVAYTAESKYRQTIEIFQYQPKEKISLIIYDDPEPMMQITMLRGGTPPMGVYYGNTLHILNPNNWVKDSSRLEDLFYSEGPVLHELVHLFTDHIGRGNFPTWFTEGVSLYFEYEIDNYQWGEWVELKDDEYTLEELTNSFYQLNQFRAYTRSFRIIKDYVENHGLEALIQLIRDLGEGANIESYYHLFTIN